jgi:hypothetical protein
VFYSQQVCHGQVRPETEEEQALDGDDKEFEYSTFASMLGEEDEEEGEYIKVDAAVADDSLKVSVPSSLQSRSQ